MQAERRFWAPQAWLGGGWAQDVLLTADAEGRWTSIQPGATAPEAAGASRLAGPVLPGVVNAHSHAFQRAIAGLTECGAAGAQDADDFWSWRTRMYSAARRITPPQLEAIATRLYTELLAGGYTQVCEFHYLHRDTGGMPYADPAEMSLALVRAAQASGMGLTLLPTLYMRAGFMGAPLQDDQRRFASTPDSVLRLAERIAAACAPAGPAGAVRINAGVAIHSLRAVDAGAIRELDAAAAACGWPVHIHIAEQQREVDDCIIHTGLRPVEWLLEHARIDARWSLVHATQATAAELAGIRARDASVVLCPGTEANLGDGVFDLPAYAQAGGRWSLGSDSHITRSWPDELRLLEYSQRLQLRQRNVASRVLGQASSAGAMLQAALDGGSFASGLAQGGLVVGQSADFLVVDTAAPALAGVPPAHVLDALVFSGPGPLFESVHVGGRRIPASERPAPAFIDAMNSLWSA